MLQICANHSSDKLKDSKLFSYADNSSTVYLQTELDLDTFEKKISETPVIQALQTQFSLDSEYLFPKIEEFHNLSQSDLSDCVYERVLPNKPLQLHAGQVIKLAGNTTMYIMQICDRNGVSQFIAKDHEVPYISKQIYSKEECTPLCRICLKTLEELPPQEVLINLCKCSGTAKWVHFKCISTWIQTIYLDHKKKGDDPYQLYNSKALSCEVCLESYPLQFRLNKRTEIYSLVKSFDRPINNNYIILCKEELEGSHMKSTCLLIPKVDSFSIGRGQCQLPVSTIDVSRLHATIKYSNQYWWIHDENSKYGTFVSVTEPTRMINSEFFWNGLQLHLRYEVNPLKWHNAFPTWKKTYIYEENSSDTTAAKITENYYEGDIEKESNQGMISNFDDSDEKTKIHKIKKVKIVKWYKPK